MVVGAPHLERVRTFEPAHDSVLIVHADRVETAEGTAEPVQPIPWWHLQILEPRHGIDLIQFPPNDRPQRARNPPSRLTIDAVPDVARGFVGQRPDHRVAL